MIKLFRLFRPFRIPIVFVFVLVFLQCLANLYLPTLMADIVNNGIVKGDTTYILQVGGIMLLVTIVGTICAVAGQFLFCQSCHRLWPSDPWQVVHPCRELFIARV